MNCLSAGGCWRGLVQVRPLLATVTLQGTQPDPTMRFAKPACRGMSCLALVFPLHRGMLMVGRAPSAWSRPRSQLSLHCRAASTRSPSTSPNRDNTAAQGVCVSAHQTSTLFARCSVLPALHKAPGLLVCADVGAVHCRSVQPLSEDAYGSFQDGSLVEQTSAMSVQPSHPRPSGTASRLRRRPWANKGKSSMPRHKPTHLTTLTWAE